MIKNNLNISFITAILGIVGLAVLTEFNPNSRLIFPSMLSGLGIGLFYGTYGEILRRKSNPDE